MEPFFKKILYALKPILKKIVLFIKSRSYLFAPLFDKYVKPLIEPLIGKPLFWVIVIGVIILAIIGCVVERKKEKKQKEKKNENNSHSKPKRRGR